MKIAFVVPGFSADENDWCIPAHTDIVKALARGHEVHVFALRYPHRVDRYPIGNATVHSFNGVGSRGGGSVQLWRSVLASIKREHKKQAFTLVHAIFGSEAGCVAMLAGKWLRVPSIVWLVNGELIGLPDIGYGADLIPRQRWMNAFILQFTSQILCGCDMLTLAARARSPRAGVETLPLGVNTARFFQASPPLPVSRDDARAHFVNVGSLLPVKAQVTLLRAFEIVSHQLPDARLTIAGVGPLQNKLSALASDLGIAARVTFAGNVPHDRLPALYQDADVFVQSSRHEGQGMALLEAAACGAAVCGTNFGALADLASQNAALVCEPDNAVALAETMLRVYRERLTYAPRAHALVTRDYNLEAIATRLQQLYISTTSR